jgi:Ni,Fe-hydrogenase I cytochrome b subunit
VKQLNQEEEKAAQAEPAENLQRYYVWDRGVRWFHWINVITVLGLIAVGTVILNATSLGVSSEGKVDLKILHAWIGYGVSLVVPTRVGVPYCLAVLVMLGA